MPEYPNLLGPLLMMIRATEAFSKVNLESNLSHLGRLAFSQQFRTVRFGVSKSAGHTETSKQLSEIYRCLYIVKTATRASQYKGPLLPAIHRASSLIGRLFDYEVVIFDSVHAHSKGEIKHFYQEVLSRSAKIPIFVLLG